MKTLCISLVILMRTLALGADALPYAELEPWVDSSVWQLPQPKSIEEFLEKYIFPQKGNTVVNKQWRDKGFYYINQGVTLLAFSLPVHFQSFAFSPHF